MAVVKNSVIYIYIFCYLKVIKECFLLLVTCIYVCIYEYILLYYTSTACSFQPSYQTLTSFDMLIYCHLSTSMGTSSGIIWIMQQATVTLCTVTLVWKCKWVTLSPLRFFSQLNSGWSTFHIFGPADYVVLCHILTFKITNVNFY